ncbi:MAG: RHS repeat domain-containing protein [bacterium]
MSAGGLSLITTNVYDTSGRLLTSIDQAGLITSYSYDPDGLVTTVTRPGGATEVTTKYLDGRTKSVTGTGVIAQYYEYRINPDSSQWTKVYTGRENSPRWEKTITDMLGRTVRVERPGFQSIGIEAEESTYDTKGQLIKTTASGLADTLYEYDEIGNQIRSGLDVNANGSLDLDANDRIAESKTYYTVIGGVVWEETVQHVYVKESDANAAITGIRRTRLTGLGPGTNTEEVISIDIHGNQTITRVVIDHNHKTETRIMDYPDSSTNEVSVSVNGLLIFSQSKTGVDTTYVYDALGRQTGITDPRIGTTITHYNSKGQVDYVEDPAGNRTRYEYDPTTGQKTAEIDALNKATRYAYNDLGQITHTWGDVPYPVHYIYDIYGQMNEMYTYRDGTNWNSETWPSESAGTGDVTRWHYDEATGLLIAKEDAAGKSVTYTYTLGGRLAARTWARLDSGSPLVTAYSYSSSTGELLSIDYSDSTPDITFNYDRLGRQKTVTDAVGTRTFAYNSSLQLQSETITGLYEKVITRTYDTGGVPGQSSGFTLGSDGISDYRLTYGYDDAGRHYQVGWNVQGNSGTATYSYLPDSDLLHQLTTDSGQKTTYSYEPHRDLRTQVKNEFNTQVISQYDYEYDPVGRRISVSNSGQAFSAVTNAFNIYQYNNRSELSESSRYLGEDLSNISNPVQSEYRAYIYDTIGNRTEIAEATETKSYTTNALNQYIQHTIPGDSISSFTYDDDGNLRGVTSDLKYTLYTYNAENQLVAVEPQNPTNSEKKIECIYDYMGRRVIKKSYRWNEVAWTIDEEILFIYDNWNIISEIKNGEQITTKYYVWGLDLSRSLQGAGGVGGLLASVDIGSSSTYYYLYDVNGNVGQLVDSGSGEIVAHYEYDPFGNGITVSGSVAGENAFRFSTKYLDVETVLVSYGYRYYFPEFGRSISKDPLEENGGANLYAFAGNDSINSIDVIGLWKWKDGRRQGNSKATVISEKCADPYKDLAKLVHLDLSEIAMWLKRWKKNAEVTENEEFLVPNTFVIAIGENEGRISRFALAQNIMALTKALERRGFLVLWYDQQNGGNMQNVIGSTINDDTWGYAFFGHGNIALRAWYDWRKDPVYAAVNGTFLWDMENFQFIGPYHLERDFKFGLGINYHCFADEQEWNMLSIKYYGARGLSVISGTRTIRWYGTWNGLVGKATD